jgi:SPP1 gp7 family putative phage head morphogenesis protein
MAFLSIRKVSESDILMCFRVPPEVLRSTVGIDSKYQNMEEARKIFWQNCVIPWQREIATFIARDPDLVPEGVKVEFDISQVEALREMRERNRNGTVQLFDSGFITINEAREREGLEPVEGGDVFKLSMGSTLEDDLDDVEEESEPNPENNPEDEENKQLPGKFRSKSLDSVNLKIALNRVGAVDEEFNGIRDFIARKYKQWATEVRSAFGRSRKAIDQAKFNEVISSLEVKWAQEIRQEVQEHMKSSIERGAESAKADLAKELILDQGEVIKAVDQESFKFAYSVSHTAAEEVRAVVKRAATEGLTIRQSRTLLAETFETWDTHRAERVARSETMRAVNKGAQLRYKAAGVTEKRWIAALDSCPICKSLDGKVVGIEEAFVPEGHELPSLDATVKQTAKYGPVENGNAHPNCRCTIGPQ